jgi:hypothetical protein
MDLRCQADKARQRLEGFNRPLTLPSSYAVTLEAGSKKPRKGGQTMYQVIAIVTLMLFTWTMAIYATVQEEPEQEPVTHEGQKAA